MGLFLLAHKPIAIEPINKVQEPQKTTTAEKAGKAAGWYGSRAVETFGPGVAVAGTVAVGTKLAMMICGGSALAAGAGSVCGVAFAPVIVPSLIRLAARISGKGIEVLTKVAAEECSNSCKRNAAAAAA